MSYRTSRRDGRGNMRNITTKIINSASSILEKDNMEDINNFLTLSEQFGKGCARNKITTSQIRGIYSEVKKLSDNFEVSKKDLNLLRPKLAYQKGRFPALEPLTDVLTALIKQVNNDTTLQGFKEFFEAIIAYHKASGGD